MSVKIAIDTSSFDSIQESLALHYRHAPLSTLNKYDRARAFVTAQYYTSNFRGTGMWGCISEVWSHSSQSNITHCRAQGKDDLFIRIDLPDGSYTYARAEHKLNRGSHMQDFIDGNSQFLVYVKDGLQPVIIPREVFIAFYNEHPSLIAKDHCSGSTEPNWHIGDTAWWARAVELWPVEYIPGASYEWSDFEGLTLQYVPSKRGRPRKG